MHAFALQTEPVDGLEELGACELREVTAGALRRLRSDAVERKLDMMSAILAATLHVDGAPIGYEALDTLPGHLTLKLDEVYAACMQMYGIATKTPIPAEASGDDAEGDAPPGEA